MYPRGLNSTLYKEDTPIKTIKRTIQIMGNAVKQSARHMPLRHYAATLAAQAPRKNYLAQLRNLYKGLLSKWKYVRDPLSQETVPGSPNAVWKLILGNNDSNVGYGDCDCVTVAMASLAHLTGFPVLFRTVLPRGQPGKYPTHVHTLAFIKGIGWYPLDPVVEPERDGFGGAPGGDLEMLWNLEGELVAYGKGGKRIWKPTHRMTS